MNRFILALLLSCLALPAFAATYCDLTNTPFLDGNAVMSCSGMTPASACYVLVTDTANGRPIQLVPDSPFAVQYGAASSRTNVSSDAIGNVAVQFTTDSIMYYEGVNYTAKMICGNSSYLKTMIPQRPVPLSARVNTYGTWAADNASALLMVGGFVFVLVFLAGLAWYFFKYAKG